LVVEVDPDGSEIAHRVDVGDLYNPQGMGAARDGHDGLDASTGEDAHLSHINGWSVSRQRDGSERFGDGMMTLCLDRHHRCEQIGPVGGSEGCGDDVYSVNV
jgi:hypothetical protein